MKGKLLCSFFLVIGLCGCASSEGNTVSAASVSSEKNITREYDGLNEKNAFYYGEEEALVNFIQNGTGVVFFGNPEKENSQKYVVYLNDVLEENDLQAAVFDIQNVQNDQKVSEQVNELLKKESDEQLVFEKEEGPLAVFLNNGKVTAWDNETSDIENVSDYWTDEKISAWREKLGNAASEIRKAQESSQNKGCEKACTFGGD